MKKLTFMKQACSEVPEFSEISKTLTRKFLVAGRSNTCVQNYISQVSKLVLFYNRSPLDLTSEEIEDYMVEFRKNDSPSLSSFKHLVHGLRHIYNLYNKTDLQVILPKVEHSHMLPVVFSKEEIRLILKTPDSIKNRVLLGTIYDSGLRVSELRKLQISDVDFDRKTIHIRQSKCKKDRYVPISEMLVRGLKQYITLYKPVFYLFNGKKQGYPMSAANIRHILKKTLEKCNITKRACIHSLRHSYATHLLEDGLDLFSLRNQLGHSDIKNTMIYIHIARTSPGKGFSPLTTLYN
jgi:integrase/recombinase XerD